MKNLHQPRKYLMKTTTFQKESTLAFLFNFLSSPISKHSSDYGKQATSLCGQMELGD